MSRHRTNGLPLRVTVLTAIALASATAMAQAQSASPGPSADAPIGWLGANEEVYRDDFSTPTTWEIADDDVGRTAYEDGGLAMTVAQDGSSLWDDHRLPAAHAVLRVEALVSGLDGEGGAGVACGSSLGLPRYLFAAVTDQAEWIFGRIIDGRMQVIDRGPIPGDIDKSDVRVGIECASSPEDGGDHILVTMDGRGVGLREFDIPVGPYDAATLMMSSDTAPLSVLFDDLVVHVGDAYAPRYPERDPSKPSA